MYVKFIHFFILILTLLQSLHSSKDMRCLIWIQTFATEARESKTKLTKFHFSSFIDFFLRMTDQKDKLSAILLKLGEYLPFATEAACKDVFNELSSFALTAASVRDEFEVLTSSTTLETRLSDLDGSGFNMKQHLIQKMSILCESCGKDYTKEFKCENCACLFHWCCAGYEREPCKDPFSKFTGRCIALQYYCQACISELSIAPKLLLLQEQEYLELDVYFSKAGCEWKWIPCHYNGYSVFSAAWAGLEGIDFLLSVFYCGVRNDSNDLDSQKNFDFLGFVSACASEALELMAFCADSDKDRAMWIQLRDNPSLPPKLTFSQFNLAWRAISHHLQSKFTICFRIWKIVADKTLMLVENYESENDYFSLIQTIDVLMWNSAVATHFDILVLEPPTKFDFDFELLN